MKDVDGLTDENTALLDTLGYITNLEINAALRLDKRSHRNFWAKKIKQFGATTPFDF